MKLQVEFEFGSFNESVEENPTLTYPKDACCWDWTCEFWFMEDGTMRRRDGRWKAGAVIGSWKLVEPGGNLSAAG